MKLVALFRKEWRESLPFVLLAVVVLLGSGTLVLRAKTMRDGTDYFRLDADADVSAYRLIEQPMLTEIGAAVLLISVGLGLAVGVRQFWIPHFLKTWAFTLHRSTSRGGVLLAKFAVAVAALLGVAVVWTLLYAYARREGVFHLPPRARTLAEGWIYVLLGLLVYLGTALSGLTAARWYTTKIFGLAFAAGLLLWTLFQTSIAAALAVAAGGMALLLVQIYHTFLTRDFE